MAAMPFPLASAQSLVGFVFSKLGDPDARRCDHSHHHARDWCERKGADWPAVQAWLRSTGGYCDCEVLFNTGRHLEAEATQ